MSKLNLIKNRNKGFLIWITGLAGSGKTTLANEIYDFIQDDLRKEFIFNKFDKKSRQQYAMSFSCFCKKITDRRINLIFATVSLFKKVRAWNKKNIENYIEVYVESDFKKLVKKRKKPFYKKVTKNIVGKDIAPELPIHPHIKIKNDFKSIKILKTQLIQKLNKVI